VKELQYKYHILIIFNIQYNYCDMVLVILFFIQKISQSFHDAVYIKWLLLRIYSWFLLSRFAALITRKPFCVSDTNDSFPLYSHGSRLMSTRKRIEHPRSATLARTKNRSSSRVRKLRFVMLLAMAFPLSLSGYRSREWKKRAKRVEGTTPGGRSFVHAVSRPVKQYALLV